MYNWSITEDLDFLDATVKNVENRMQRSLVDQTRRNSIGGKNHRNESRKNSSSMLVDLVKIQPELAKFYKQHFTKQVGESHPHNYNDRVRLFRVEGHDKELENDLLFLLHRATDSKEKSFL